MSQLVLCSLVSAGTVVVPGSVRRVCVGCQQPVWMSPTTVAAERERPAGDAAWTAICMDCCSKRPEQFEPEFVPGSAEELSATLAIFVGRKGRS